MSNRRYAIKTFLAGSLLGVGGGALRSQERQEPSLGQQKQLTNLAPAGALANDDVIYAAQGGAEKKLSIAQLASYVQAPMAKGVSPDAGALTGAETLPASRGTGLLQTDVGSVAAFAREALAAPGGSTLVGFKSLPPSSVARTVADELNDADINPKRFGAKGNDSADDSAAIQTAIDLLEARGGGVVRFPAGNYRCNVILKDGVSLVSGSEMFGYLPGRISGVTLSQASTGFVVDSPRTLIRGTAVNGLNFAGLGANYEGGGVRLRNAKWGAIKRCTANNFADQGFQHIAGFGIVFEDILTTNVLLNRHRTQVSGCIETFGTDDFLNRIEANPSLIASDGVVSNDLYICGILVGGANNFLSNCIGEDAERGIYIAPLRGSQHRISLCRGDSNVGHGFYVDGSALWAACFAYFNSSGSVGKYSGFYMSALSRENLLTSCRSQGTSNRLQKYGFEDHVSRTDPALRNTYAGCAGAYNQSGLFLTQQRGGSGVLAAPQAISPADGTSVVDITGNSLVVLEGYRAPANLRNFNGGVDGESVRVLGNSQVTIVPGAGIVTSTGKSVVLADHTVYTFTQYGGNWYMG